MTEVRKESLSALIDGEASELEVHRLVREFRSDDSLNTSWAVFQKIRATARRDADPLTIEHHHQLFGRISAAIESEASHDISADTTAGSRSAPSQKVIFGSLALAASLVVAVFVGVQQPEQTTPLAEATPVGSNMISATPVSVQNVAATQLPQAQLPLEGSPELVELDAEKQKQLRAYLNQHDRMARMNTGKQFVNYPGNTERAASNK